MPRPSLKAERRDQIFDAVETCVARHGVDGATQERIAEQAGLARALIRHNVGNREDMLTSCLDRFLGRTTGDLEAMLGLLPPEDRVTILVDWLFDPQYSDPRTVLVWEAFAAWSSTRPEAAKRLRAWISGWVNALRHELAAEYRNSPDADIRAVAAGLTGIYFNVESLAPIGGLPELRDASRMAALRLIATLDH